MSEEMLGFTDSVRTIIVCVCVVCKSASLTHFLEHDSVHTTAIVFVEQRCYALLLRIPCTCLVMVHTHVDVLGIVRRNPNLVGRCLLHGEWLSLWGWGESLGSLVVFAHNIRQFLLAERTIIQNGMLKA